MPRLQPIVDGYIDGFTPVSFHNPANDTTPPNQPTTARTGFTAIDNENGAPLYASHNYERRLPTYRTVHPPPPRYVYSAHNEPNHIQPSHGDHSEYSTKSNFPHPASYITPRTPQPRRRHTTGIFPNTSYHHTDGHLIAEDRYRAVDPFQKKPPPVTLLLPHPDTPQPGLFGPSSPKLSFAEPSYAVEEMLTLPTVNHHHRHHRRRRRHVPRAMAVVRHVLNAVYVFLWDTTPREVYLSLLLRLPSLYFARVARVFEDAELSKPDIRRMVHARAEEWEGRRLLSDVGWEDEAPGVRVSSALMVFKRSWEDFVDSLMREWKTLNLVSVLLLSAILTVLQIQGAGDDPVTRTAALLSLLCALTSLSYGCIFIVRFGTMKKMHKASSWADEARKTDTVMWWNVWVMLAMPAIWLAWSMASFLVCILSFVWRTGSTLDPPTRAPLPPKAVLGVRLAITAVFALGLVYSLLIVRTLRRYGRRMDEAWMNRALEWQKEGLGDGDGEGARTPPPAPVPPTRGETPSQGAGQPEDAHAGRLIPAAFLRPSGIGQAQEAAWLRERVAGLPPCETVKVAGMDGVAGVPGMPGGLGEYDVWEGEWDNFMQDVLDAWAGRLEPCWTRRARRSRDGVEMRACVVGSIVDTWNIRYFIRRGVEVFLYRGRECWSGQRFGPESGRIPVGFLAEGADGGTGGGPGREEYVLYVTRRALLGPGDHVGGSALAPSQVRKESGWRLLERDAGAGAGAGRFRSWEDLVLRARGSWGGGDGWDALGGSWGGGDGWDALGSVGTQDCGTGDLDLGLTGSGGDEGQLPDPFAQLLDTVKAGSKERASTVVSIPTLASRTRGRTRVKGTLEQSSPTTPSDSHSGMDLPGRVAGSPVMSKKDVELQSPTRNVLADYPPSAASPLPPFGKVTRSPILSSEATADIRTASEEGLVNNDTQLHRDVDDWEGTWQGHHIFTVPSPFFRPISLPAPYPPFPRMKIWDAVALPATGRCSSSASDDILQEEPDVKQGSEPSSAMRLILEQHDIDLEDWTRFMHDLDLALTGKIALKFDERVLMANSDVVAEFVKFWNEAYFLPREISVSVVDERGPSLDSSASLEPRNQTLYLSYVPLEDTGSNESVILFDL